MARKSSLLISHVKVWMMDSMTVFFSVERPDDLVDRMKNIEIE